jgi:hypothetical protein
MHQGPLGTRRRLAAVAALCLGVVLAAAPAALAAPVLPEGDDPNSVTPTGGGATPQTVQTASGGADWTDGVLVAAVAFALAVAAIALVATVRNPSPDPTPHA